MESKQKIIGVILGVILFIILIAGVTYAYITWTSEKIKYTVGSKCFNILYDNGNDLTGTMMPGTSYTGGLSVTVKMDIDSSCDINANGKLYLNTLNTTSSNLLDSDRVGLLNYQVLKGSSVISGGSGTITEVGTIEIDLGQLNKNTSASTQYTVYVWINNNLIENSDFNSKYYGNISAEAIQFE